MRLSAFFRTKKRKIASTICTTIFIFSVYYFFFYYQESEMFAGFPVPLAANLVKADQENRYEEYKWWAASETDSITPYYWLVIRIWGWQEKEREGASTTYEKDGTEVFLSSFDKVIYLQ
ncbi:hypothetical protein AB9M62_04715 [Bacillales bacterium AN1005]|uniref:hypothetical protein n=1 Tax=Niallia taxi TaxID=2499688 RepID=UPI0021A66C7F|nr:hypothetical protein [Niallia taxi]MCT2346183.1 hypothetical protein [Niallia taxi]